MLSSSSAGPYKPDMPMQPRPSADTFGPVPPSCRVSMRSTSPGGAPRYQDRPIGGSTIPGCGADDSAEWGHGPNRARRPAAEPTVAARAGPRGPTARRPAAHTRTAARRGRRPGVHLDRLLHAPRAGARAEPVGRRALGAGARPADDRRRAGSPVPARRAATAVAARPIDAREPG